MTDDLDTRYLFEINERWTIDGSSRRNRARYINHACRPNAEVYFVKHVIKIRAIKNIKPGDEITYHYGRNYFDAFIKEAGCKCMACRKKVLEASRRGRLVGAAVALGCGLAHHPTIVLAVPAAGVLAWPALRTSRRRTLATAAALALFRSRSSSTRHCSCARTGPGCLGRRGLRAAQRSPRT